MAAIDLVQLLVGSMALRSILMLPHFIVWMDEGDWHAALFLLSDWQMSDIGWQPAPLVVVPIIPAAAMAYSKHAPLILFSCIHSFSTSNNSLCQGYAPCWEVRVLLAEGSL
jgi:hypothetical protein